MDIIEVTDLTKTYGAKRALDGVSLSVNEGEILGILGPNGAGKTSLVECIAGLRAPDSGEVRVTGLDPRADRAAITALLGVQLQESQLQDKITVREAIDLFAAFYDDPAPTDMLITRLGLADKADAAFAGLSGGQKQRLSIALALVGRPRIVILDELTTGLDPRARREVWGLIEDVHSDGVTMLLVTHFMDEAQHLCDRIAFVRDGRIVALDTPAGVLARSGAPLTITFEPSRPVQQAELTALPGVSHVEAGADRVTVSATDEGLTALVDAVAGHGISMGRLRIAESSLDDAFLALTGVGQEPEAEPEPEPARRRRAFRGAREGADR